MEMKKSISFLFMAAALALVGGISLSFNYGRQKDTVPEEYKTMQNPVKANAQNLEDAKEEYKKNCASCHGKTGLGDGPKAKTCEHSCGDFTSDPFQKKPDGVLFYRTKFGKDEMPAYKGKIADDDIWGIVNYMRTFKK